MLEDMTMSKRHLFGFVCVLMLLGWAGGAQATDYTCPAANLVNCEPAQKKIGAWNDNGGMMTGNTFAPNNMCANVIDLPNGMKRLLCCYKKCGFFYQDVKATECTKTSESQFSCK